MEQCSAIEYGQSDDCGDETQHSEAQHCHCSPINHFKIFPHTKIVMMAPCSNQAELIPISESLLVSHFESLIFHPPIV